MNAPARCVRNAWKQERDGDMNGNEKGLLEERDGETANS